MLLMRTDTYNTNTATKNYKTWHNHPFHLQPITTLLALLEPTDDSSKEDEDKDQEDHSNNNMNNLIKFSSSSIPLNLNFGRISSPSSSSADKNGGSQQQQQTAAEERIDDQLFDPRVISEDIRARIPIGT